MHVNGFGKSGVHPAEETRVEIYSTSDTFDTMKVSETKGTNMHVPDNDSQEKFLKSDYGKETFSIVASKFIDSTSAHGFYQVKLRKKSITKLFWTSILLAAFTGLGLHLSILVMKYLDYGYEETTELVLESPLFPDVTICNMDAISSDLYRFV